ncbi:4008_t:CDS:10 [Diversispora eburnea]|uniref:Vesicular-fusion protein SEC18 n=1 Tax=Diversispora eburnea TaxID=1213867 RepID=A0A9N9BFL9_9GLOM|nr:4008_t:CDS:10 [Diversispora eburnea]
MDPYNRSRQPPYSSPQPRQPAPPLSQQTVKMKVQKCSSEQLALTNYLIVSTRDFHPNVPDESQASHQIGTSMVHRRWASLSLGQEVSVVTYDPFAESPFVYMIKLDLEVGFLRKAFNNQMFSVGQVLVLEFHGVNLQIIIKSIQVADQDTISRVINDETFDPNVPNKGGVGAGEVKGQAGIRDGIRGILTQQTAIHWSKAAESSIILKAQNSLIQPDFKFEDMGIGGLDTEFSAIFRRAFASRIFPPSLVEKLGIQHVKGILLYGPPGTGKTLMARQIGKMLNAREPKIVNGPEILNKYVGQSEENVRKLFADAEKEYKAKGEDSGLHIIIFDELDAICKQRGGRSDGTGVGDNVVNQLLAKLDGVEQLNNILIIGMTNRLDLIDEALLRPGRLEVHMEIGLPDEKGRLQILKIHTSKMRQNDILDFDVDFEELASLTKNFSGAEINGLVKSASSFAFNRHVKVGTLAGVTPDVENMKVNRNDFLDALEEVQPAFGVSDEELEQCIQNSIIKFSPFVERILADGQLYIDQVKNSSRTPLVSVLLHGPSGSGKTALAATMARSSEFPFIKLISPESMVGYSELSKTNAIHKDRRLLIIATTNEKSVLEQMNMSDCFNSEIYVPHISELTAVDIVLQELTLFNDEERKRVLEILQEDEIKLKIGIKKLLMIIEMSRQDVDKVDKFVSTIMGI